MVEPTHSFTLLDFVAGQPSRKFSNKSKRNENSAFSNRAQAPIMNSLGNSSLLPVTFLLSYFRWLLHIMGIASEGKQKGILPWLRENKNLAVNNNP